MGQKFAIDATLFCDLAPAGASDDLAHTVNYASVYSIIGDIVQGRPHQLLESLAEKICREVLASDARIAAVQLAIRKPQVAVAGVVESLGIEIKRCRAQ